MNRSVEDHCIRGQNQSTTYHISEDVSKRNIDHVFFGGGVHESDSEGAQENDVKTVVKCTVAVSLTYSPGRFSITANRRPQEAASSIVVSPAVHLGPGLPL